MLKELIVERGHKYLHYGIKNEGVKD